MTTLIIILVAVVVIAVLVSLVLNPILQKRGDTAIEDARTALGGRDNVTLIEPKAVGHGSEPDEAGGLRGQGVLALSADKLAFVSWAPRKSFVLDRSAITGVTTSAPDAAGDGQGHHRARLHQRRGPGHHLVPPARAGPLARRPRLRLGPRGPADLRRRRGLTPSRLSRPS